MTPPRMSEDTLGDVYVDEDGRLWRHILYCSAPSATLERVDVRGLTMVAEVRISGVVGAHVFNPFTRLVPDQS